MFGRVPRLPVDLLFKNVLNDVTVCDYDAYVKSLLDDLHCAMALAQLFVQLSRDISVISTTNGLKVNLCLSVTRFCWQIRASGETKAF